MKPSKTIINAAAYEAKDASHRHHHGAVVFDKSVIISSGHNLSFRYSTKIPPELKTLYYPGSMHAEVMAIINMFAKAKFVPYDRREMLVVRINKQMQLRDSCPCNSCMEVLAYYNFKRVWFYHKDFYGGNTILDCIDIKRVG